MLLLLLIETERSNIENESNLSEHETDLIENETGLIANLIKQESISNMKKV